RPERRWRAVVFDLELIDERRRRPASAQAAQLVLEDVERLLHPFLSIEQDFVGTHVILRPHAVSTIVPIAWPAMARSMFPSLLKLNTRIGNLALRHKSIAAASITRRLSRITWACVNF